MARKVIVQLLRGTAEDLPLLYPGEMCFTTDTHQLWIGTDEGQNILIGAPLKPDTSVEGRRAGKFEV